jgi:hypothetical protein
LEAAPKIRLFPITDARAPYPLNTEEQSLLFQELPDHLARMALFKVNTGTREQEVCCLKWEYEVKVPELDTSVFLIPGERVKNGEERLVVLNRVAKSVIEAMRGVHPVYVFARARHEAHLWSPTTRCRRELRRSPGFARAQERAHYDALLPSRTGDAHRGGGQGVRDRVPQNSRNHLAASQSELTERR